MVNRTRRRSSRFGGSKTKPKEQEEQGGEQLLDTGNGRLFAVLQPEAGLLLADLLPARFPPLVADRIA